MDGHSGQADPRIFLDTGAFSSMRERLFARSWQWMGDLEALSAPGSFETSLLLPGLLDEPILAWRGTDGTLRTFLNACSHRGHAVGAGRGCASKLACPYHARRFDANGNCLGQPFVESAGFPGDGDALRKFPSHESAPWWFAAVDPGWSVGDWLEPFLARCGHLPLADMRRDDARVSEYVVDASWILYVDNYLEGLHIPFLHGGLDATLAFERYRYATFARSTLQIGVAAEGEPAFDPPEGHPDHGLRVAAWWWWLWPNLMLNVYPWGVSVNVVIPESPTRTRIRFIPYMFPGCVRGGGAGGDLHRVEMEDEAAILSVQRGIASRLWRPRPHLPVHEDGLARFHALLGDVLGTT